MPGLDSPLLWTPAPDAAHQSAMARFFAYCARTIPGAPAADAPYAAWHAWSVRESPAFWAAWWDACGVMSDPFDAVLRDGEVMRPPGAEDGPRWFTGARLNFAEHLLRRRDAAPAIIARDERGRRREFSFAELADAVSRAAEALRAGGVQPGDCVAGFLPNIPEAVIAALAANAVGAVWSSCSPDFGAQGVLDRFGQIEPVVLITADGYSYAGKALDCLERVRAIAAGIPSIRRVVVVPFLGCSLGADALAGLLPLGRGASEAWDDFLAPAATAAAPVATARTDAAAQASTVGGPDSVSFVRFPFDYPLYVMYSSGTTGLPKCMVHGQGGTLLQHLKEHRLHCDLRPGDRMFYFTTCGWMMWNWLVTALASEVAIVLYDGAPMPMQQPSALWDIVAEERVTHFGTSAKFLALSQKCGHAPLHTHDLTALRMILSTGSPLAEYSYDFV